jgi:hypothetical protein
MAETVMRFEQSDLPERQKAALRLAAAFLGQPRELSAEARAAALEEFSPEEIVGIVFKLTAYSWNKVRVAFGIDRPVEEGQLTAFEYGDDGAARLLPDAGS